LRDVYRALDSRLGRTVAFKVLRIGLAREATLRQRFDREAKIISGLSHPHICSCFDIGESARRSSPPPSPSP
jgi:serine/threonine-protein kinase